MASELLKIDPNGDTLFVLRCSDAPFAADDPSELWPITLSPYWTPEQKQNEGISIISTQVAVVAPVSTSEIRLQLSSKHLALASTYFQRLMLNGWKETKEQNGYAYTITAEEWDPNGLIILMDIIHGRSGKVPQTVDLETLAKIAVLVDYYGCHAAVHFFSEIWIKNLGQPLNFLSYSRELLLRLFVTYVFSDHFAFLTLTKTIITESRGPIPTLGLPIPQAMVGKFQKP